MDIHNDDSKKKHPCTMCEKAFINVQALTKHKFTHIVKQDEVM